MVPLNVTVPSGFEGRHTKGTRPPSKNSFSGRAASPERSQRGPKGHCLGGTVSLQTSPHCKADRCPAQPALRRDFNMHKRYYATMLTVLVVAFVATACSGQTASPTAAAPTAAPTSAAQAVAEAPSFTHPIEITNPFYPISLISHTIELGQEEGKLARLEVTRLQDTKMIAGG